MGQFVFLPLAIAFLLFDDHVMCCLIKMVARLVEIKILSHFFAYFFLMTLKGHPMLFATDIL